MKKLITLLALAILLMAIPVSAGARESNNERREARWAQIREFSQQRLGVNHIWGDQVYCFYLKNHIESMQTHNLNMWSIRELSRKLSNYEVTCKQ